MPRVGLWGWEGSAASVLRGAAEGAGMVQTGEGEAQGGLMGLSISLQGGCGELGVSSWVTAIGWEVMASSCATGGSGWMSGEASSQKEWSCSGTAAQGMGGRRPWGCSELWGCGTEGRVVDGLLQGLGILVVFSNLIDSMEGLGGKHSPSH